MNIHWRKGLSGATSRERAVLIQAEALARGDAVVAECDKRCVDSDLGIAECTDIEVLGSVLKWGRKSRKLYVLVVVFLKPGLVRREYKWRVPPGWSNISLGLNQRVRVARER